MPAAFETTEYRDRVQQVSAAALLLLLGYLWLADGLYLDAVAAQRLATGTTLMWRVMELRWLRRLVGRRVAAVARKELPSAASAESQNSSPERCDVV